VVLLLSLKEGARVPEALPALLFLALKRSGVGQAARFLKAQEEERRRVGRELHDGVGSLLTAALLTLKVAEKRPEKLPEARAQVAEALEEVRKLSRELRMPLLDDLGLEAALRRYLEEYRKNGLEVEADLRVPPLPKEKGGGPLPGGAGGPHQRPAPRQGQAGQGSPLAPRGEALWPGGGRRPGL
jgi:signal transduction histidine kinase